MAALPGHRRRTSTRASLVPPARGLLPLAVLLGFWELTASANSPYFPRPSSWAQALGELWSGGELLPAALATITTFGLALGTAIVLGTMLGLLVGGIRPVDRALNPTLEFARAMPPAAIIPIATLLLGYNEQMKVAVATSAAIWPILFNSRAALRRLDPVLVETARSLHLTTFERLRKITFPALLPGIFLGVRIGGPSRSSSRCSSSSSPRSTVSGGLIATAQRSYLSDQVWGLILVAGLFSLCVGGLIAKLENHALRHRPTP
jgi:ABC-type nitrate/sulfonate/bicarbonate transport system permease component